MDFNGARLEGVDFSYSNLSRATFAGADMSGLNFEGAWTYLTHFEGADLSRVTRLTQQQVDQSCGDSETRLPPGLQASDSWPCVE